MKKLKCPHIAISLTEKKYQKLQTLLPAPSIKSVLSSSFNGNTIELVYSIEGVIKTPSQWRWINSIKCYLEKKITKCFDWVEDVYINCNSEITGVTYSLEELTELFGPRGIEYPDIFYTSDRRQLYRHLCMYASALHYRGILHFEGVYAGALLLSKHIHDLRTFNERELWGKAKAACEYILKNPQKYKQRLSQKELTSALKNGGKIRGMQKSKEHSVKKSKFISLLRQKAFKDKNGKPNVKLLAEKLEVDRRTIYNYLSSINTPKTIASFTT